MDKETMESQNSKGLGIPECAKALGGSFFELCWRVQSGEVEAQRASGGEFLIPEKELLRLGVGGHRSTVSGEDRESTAGEIGIEERIGGLRKNGENTSFKIKGVSGAFNRREIEAYGEAFRPISREVERIQNLKRQMEAGGKKPQIQTLHFEGAAWNACSVLLQLDQSEIFLCDRQGEFAVVNQNRRLSLNSKSTAQTEILLQGTNAQHLVEEFKQRAQLTLEFMASNLLARAQKIAWEQFPNQNPGRIVAAISEKCVQAVSNEQIMGQNSKSQQSVSKGVRV